MYEHRVFFIARRNKLLCEHKIFSSFLFSKIQEKLVYFFGYYPREHVCKIAKIPTIITIAVRKHKLYGHHE